MPIETSSENGTRRVVVRCVCGFSYAQIGGQKMVSSMMDKVEILSPTARWIYKFLHVWNICLDLDMEQVAANMGLSVTTIAKYVIKSKYLSLPSYDVDLLQYTSWIRNTIQNYNTSFESAEAYARIRVELVLNSTEPINERVFINARKKIEFLTVVHVTLNLERKESKFDSLYMKENNCVVAHALGGYLIADTNKITEFVYRYFGCKVIHLVDPEHGNNHPVKDFHYRIICYDQHHLSQIISWMVGRNEAIKHTHEELAMHDLRSWLV